MNQKLSGTGGRVQCGAGIWARRPAPGSFHSTLSMLPRRLSSLLSVLVLAVGPGPAPPHTWIADLRANPSRFAAVELLLEGDVVELRSISPGAERGMYRLGDGSDHRGGLVGTDHLPGGGGAHRGPAAGGADPPRPPLRYDPEAEEADIRQRERLRQRKQHLAYALVAALAVTVTSGTWAARNFPRSPRVPVYVSV